jgi:hypothetical protein
LSQEEDVGRDRRGSMRFIDPNAIKQLEFNISATLEQKLNKKVDELKKSRLKLI